MLPFLAGERSTQRVLTRREAGQQPGRDLRLDQRGGRYGTTVLLGDQSALGRPVVLVHGWGGSFLNTWQKSGFTALLEDADRAVIGVDLLGHGREIVVEPLFARYQSESHKIPRGNLSRSIYGVTGPSQRPCRKSGCRRN